MSTTGEHGGVAFGTKPYLKEDQGKWDELLGRLNDLGEENARTAEGSPTFDPREWAIAQELKMLGRPPDQQRLSGQLMDASKRTYKYAGADPNSENFLAQAGRGVGTVAEMYPAAVLGGAPAVAIQGASGAYAQTYDRSIKETAKATPKRSRMLPKPPSRRPPDWRST